MNSVILLKDKEKSLLRKHPWVFSGAIKKVIGKPESGETVSILDCHDNILGYGAYSPHSQIRIRMWNFNAELHIDEEFFQKKLVSAWRQRSALHIERASNSYRLVNSENDGLPGLIVDKYDEYLVCQFLSAGSEYWKNTIVNILQQQDGITGIYERSDTTSRFKEGLTKESKLLWGKEPPEEILIREHQYKLLVDIRKGHKTGFYLDQRENRRILSDFAENKDILNCFSYTGGFSISASLGGAKSITNVDASASVLDIAEKNSQINSCENIKNIKADVFNYLRKCEQDGQKLDIVVLDPPKFAESASQLEKAAKGYKDINYQSFKILKPGGLLFTFSCSGHMKQDLFEKIVADAAVDSGRSASVIKYLTQAEDHNVALNFPEGKYLKGIICRVNE